VNTTTNTTGSGGEKRVRRGVRRVLPAGISCNLPPLAIALFGIWLLFLGGCSAERRVEKHLRKGEIYLRTFQLTGAAAEFEEALELDPDNVTAHYQLGSVRSAQNDHARAVAHFKHVLELAPDHRDAYHGLGSVYVAQQDFGALAALADTMDKAGIFAGLAANFRGIAAQINGDNIAAVEAFSQAAKENPQLTEAWLNLAILHSKLKDDAAAVATCRAAIDATGPEDHTLQMLLAESLRRLGKNDEAVSVLLADIDRHPDELENRVRLGDIYLRTNEIDKLRDLGVSILERNSRSPFGKYFIGVADLSDGNYRQSAENLGAVAIAAPDITGAYLYLALAQERIGAVQQAITHARRYLRAVPDSVQARVILARLYNNEGWTDEATALIDEASALDPTNVDVLAVRGAIALGEQDYTTAIRDFESMLDEAPDDIRAKLSLALVALGKNNPDGAIAHARDVVNIDPDDPRAYNVLGLAYMQKGDLQTALAELTKARTLRPDFLPVRRNLARLYAGLRQFEATEKEYAAIIGMRPNDPTVRLALGYLMLGHGLYERAAETFRTVLTMQPDDIRARIALATALSRSGASDEAVAVLSERLSDSSAAARLYYAIGRTEFRRKAYDKAVAAYAGAVEMNPEMGGAYIDQGLALMMDGKAAEGAERIAEAVGKGPSAAFVVPYEAAARVRAGQADRAVALLDELEGSLTNTATLETVRPVAYLAAGDPAAARQAAERVASESAKTDLIELIDRCESLSERPVTWIPASLVLMERRWMASALDAANMAVEQLPDVVLPHLVRASIELRLQDVHAALEDFQAALALRPGDPAIVQETVAAHIRLREYPAAIALLDKAAEAEPNSIRWLHMLGEVNMQSGNNEQARSFFERVIEANPNDSRAANNLAYLYLADEQRPADALRLAEQASRVRPADGNVLDTLGWAYLKNNKIEEAVETLDMAAGLMPGNPTVLYHYGEALNRAGRAERAVEMWRAALDTDRPFPESDTVRAALASRGPADPATGSDQS